MTYAKKLFIASMTCNSIAFLLFSYSLIAHLLGYPKPYSIGIGWGFLIVSWIFIGLQIYEYKKTMARIEKILEDIENIEK